MFSEILTIGPVTVHGYGLMIAIGLLCAIILANYRAGKKGLDKDNVFNIIIVAVIFGFLGAKIMYLLENFKAFLDEPLKYFFSGEGFLIYGGIILGVAATIIYCRIKKLNFLEHFDLLMPSVSVAQGFGRIGCLGAGCCYGKETDSVFGIVFNKACLAPTGVKLIPTQIISSVGNFLIAGILIWYASKDRQNGKVGLLYLILYGAGRFGVEFLRNDHNPAVGFMSIAQVISLVIVVIAAVIFAIYKRREDSATN